MTSRGWLGFPDSSTRTARAGPRRRRASYHRDQEFVRDLHQGGTWIPGADVKCHPRQGEQRYAPLGPESPGRVFFLAIPRSATTAAVRLG